MKMKKYSVFLLLLAIALSMTFMVSVKAGGQGQIRIEPHAFDPPDPVILNTPATFTITVVEHTAYCPQILLVISEDCYDGLGIITVDWNWDPYLASLGFTQGSFTWIDKGWVPDSGDGFGKIYQAKSLKDHLGVPEDEGIWYAYGPMPVSDIEEGDSYEVTITVDSSDPRALVYVFGCHSKVPPTRPGFIIPEIPLGTIATILAMMSALLLRNRVAIKIQ